MTYIYTKWKEKVEKVPQMTEMSKRAEHSNKCVEFACLMKL